MKNLYSFITILLGITSLDCRAGEKITPAKAILAGGCFWCIESSFLDIEGINEVVSGYTGGHTSNPDYESVSSGKTGHYEAVELTYNPGIISYNELLDIFWSQIDPTDPSGQFADRGSQYKTAIFYLNEEQRRIAEKSRSDLESSGRFKQKIVTEIIKAKEFYKAEQYHQKYCKINPERYNAYKKASGRSDFILKNRDTGKKSHRKKFSNEELKSRLTPLQYNVTRECGTEPPFRNDYWNNKREGLYVDIVTGEPLFTSSDKFDSGTGWPSFTKPVVPESVKTKTDFSLNMPRTEVQSSSGNHLGHVFDDGPAPGGKRYCINSASLRFIPVSDLEKEGYAEYKKNFKNSSKDIKK